MTGVRGYMPISSGRALALGLIASGLLFISDCSISQTALAQEQAAAEPADDSFCSQLLTAHPQGGDALSAEVKALVQASPAIANDIHSCACPAANAQTTVLPNAAQSQAIGLGLAQAVKKLKKNPEAVDAINLMITNSCSKSLQTAYLSGVTDEATAAPGGNGNGQGGPGNGNGGPPAPFTPGNGNGNGNAPVLVVTPGGGGTGGGAVSRN